MKYDTFLQFLNNLVQDTSLILFQKLTLNLKYYRISRVFLNQTYRTLNLLVFCCLSLFTKIVSRCLWSGRSPLDMLKIECELTVLKIGLLDMYLNTWRMSMNKLNNILMNNTNNIILTNCVFF